MEKKNEEGKQEGKEQVEKDKSVRVLKNRKINDKNYYRKSNDKSKVR